MPELAIFGLGELGKLFGGAALAAGYRVTPVLRKTPVPPVFEALAERTPLLIAVPEPSLSNVLASLPQARRADAILLQNELFPALWAGEPEAPTVMIPWLLKKKGDPQIVIRATPVFGRHADTVVDMHQALGVACVVLDDAAALARELVHKYAFILTINALGVWRDRTLGRWLAEEPVRVRDLAIELTRLGARLAAVEVDEAVSVQMVLQGMQAMASVSARGRSASTRLLRALGHTKRLGLTLPLLERIACDAQT